METHILLKCINWFIIVVVILLLLGQGVWINHLKGWCYETTHINTHTAWSGKKTSITKWQQRMSKQDCGADNKQKNHFVKI